MAKTKWVRIAPLADTNTFGGAEHAYVAARIAIKCGRVVQVRHSEKTGKLGLYARCPMPKALAAVATPEASHG